MKRYSSIAAFIALLLYVTVFAQSPTSGTITKDANLRAGPGTSYAIAGAAKAGQAVTIVGKNDAGDWYQLDSKAWIAAFLVDVSDVSVPTPTTKAIQSVTSTPVPTSDSQTYQVNIHNDPVAKAYGDEIRKALDLYAKGAKIANAHFMQVSDNPAIVLDKTWQNGMIVGLSELKLCSQALRKLTPPPYLADVNAGLLELADHLENAVDLWASGIDTLDGAKIREGTSEFALSGTLAKTANAKMTVLLDASTPTPRATIPVATSKASPTRTPASTATTKSVVIPTATSKLAWYSGGTLHDATVDEWKAADERNKLATAADWAYVGFDNVHFSTPDEVRPYAEQVVICVDTALAGDTDMGDSATDIASLCIILMKSK